MAMSPKCFFCDCNMHYDIVTETNNHVCNCINCGKYTFTEELFTDLKEEKFYKDNLDKLYLISGYLREMTDRGIDIGVISHQNIGTLFSHIKSPKKLSEKIEKMLSYFLKNTEFFSQGITLDLIKCAICYAKNAVEYRKILETMVELDYLHDEGGLTYSLTISGFEKAESLEKESINSSQCFFAMMFNDEMKKIFFEYVKPAIKEKTGYDAFIVSMKEHNNDICDEIIAEIRKSKFMIADFTGQRGGVYFEAGFAYGLGLPVIWTCKKEEEKKLHFDINHYNFILWDTPKELCERLCNRISATII